MPRKADLIVLPTPKKAARTGGYFNAPKPGCFRSSDAAAEFQDAAREALAPILSGQGRVEFRPDLSSRPPFWMLFGATRGRIPTAQPLTPKPFGVEGYRLTIRASHILLEARQRPGFFYGLATLRQILRNYDRAPCCRIEDWPDMAVRGVHMDLKGCTPTVDYMKRLIPQLAEYKINTLLMEYENAVQLDSTPGVAKPSAWSKSDVEEMADLARRHFIDLMPLVQSLGHVEYILEHDRYKHLRESAEDVSQYCPSNPKTFPFWAKQADEVLELFPQTKYFHVGADETRLLGHCPKCKKSLGGNRDELELYLDHMMKVWRHVLAQDRTPIFWDDMIARSFSPSRIRRIPKDVAVMYWLYHISGDRHPTVRLHGGGYGRRESIRHEALGEARSMKHGQATRWLDEVDPVLWRNCRKYVDDPDCAPDFPSTPFIEMFAEHGHEVFGGSAAKCGMEEYALPGLALRLDNIRTWARGIARANQSGVVSTAWSRNASLSNPYLPFDTMWYPMAASGQFYWSSESSVEEFQKAFDLDFFGVDDDGRIAQLLEAVSLENSHPAATREFAQFSVSRNQDVFEAYRLGAQLHRGYMSIFASLLRHARGYYLKGRPFIGNRNAPGKWLTGQIAAYLKLEPEAAKYYHRVMLPEEADELVESQFRFFKDADLGLG
jgi:hypothetical protein